MGTVPRAAFDVALLGLLALLFAVALAEPSRAQSRATAYLHVGTDVLTAPTDTEAVLFGTPAPGPVLQLPRSETVFHGMGMGADAYHPGLNLGLGVGYRMSQFLEVTLGARYTHFSLDEAAVVSHYQKRNRGLFPVEVSVEGGSYTISAALAGVKAASPPVGRFTFYAAARGGLYRHAAAPYTFTLALVPTDPSQPVLSPFSLSERKQTEVTTGMEIGIGLTVAVGPALRLFVEPAYAFSSTTGWDVTSVPVLVGISYGGR